MKITLPLPPSYNAAYPTNFKTGKRFMSRRGTAWVADALWALKTVSEKFDQCHISYRFYYPDLRKRDNASFTKLPADCLVKAGIIPDDNWQVIVSEDLSGTLDRESPRLEIEITPPKLGYTL